MEDEDIELAADWNGECGTFARTVRELGFLDGTSGCYMVHDWTEHNPWVASRGQRVEAARKAAAARWGCGMDAQRMQGVCESHADRNAHHPTQPDTQPKPKTTSAAASATPESAPLITLPLNDGNEYPISAETVREFAELYPAIDVVQELRKMRGWLLANKRNRKTSAGVLRFVTSWLSKEQDRSPRSTHEEQRVAERQSDTAPAYDLPAGLDSDGGESAWRTALESLSHRINPHSFETWIRPVRAVGIRDDRLFLTLPTKDFAHVQHKYGGLIAEAVGGLKVEYLTPEEKAC